MLGAIAASFGAKFETETLVHQNWNALWESNFEPVIVDDFCAIRADFHQPFDNVEFELIINPKMSFGTGHHATTYLMIQQMRDLEFNEKLVEKDRLLKSGALPAWKKYLLTLCAYLTI